MFSGTSDVKVVVFTVWLIMAATDLLSCYDRDRRSFTITKTSQMVRSSFPYVLWSFLYYFHNFLLTGMKSQRHYSYALSLLFFYSVYFSIPVYNAHFLHNHSLNLKVKKSSELLMFTNHLRGPNS